MTRVSVKINDSKKKLDKLNVCADICSDVF